MDTSIDQSWAYRAACKKANLNIFFPIRFTKNTVRIPFSICDTCLVQPECLFQAMTTSSVGIWAKTTDHQRSQILMKYFNNNSKKFTLENAYEILNNDCYSLPINSKSIF